MKYFIKALLIFMFISIVKVNAQEQSMSMEEQMKAWQEYMTPGENHKLLGELVGDWKFTMKMWQDPAAEPQVYEGTAKYEMMLDGRYLSSVQKGVMMGMPFEGHMIQGFDNKTREFTSIWYDNFGTGILVSKGTYDPVKKEFTYRGSSVDPMTGKDFQVKEVDKEVTKNKRHMDYYMIQDGKEFKNMEIDYVRQ